VVLIRGLGPIPAFGTAGSAMGTCIASGLVALYALVKLWRGGWVVSFPRGAGLRPDWTIIRSLFRFGLPTGIQGIAMNVGGVLMLAFIGSLAQSAAAQAAFAVSYGQLFSLVTWTAMGLMGAAAAVAGQNLGAGQPDRAEQAVHAAARVGLGAAALLGPFFFFFPAQLLAVFGMNEPVVVEIGTQLLRVLSVSGLFIAVALTYTGGLQGTGDTKSPLYISIVSQVAVPLGICFTSSRRGRCSRIHVWVAILVGHAALRLSVLRFNQGKVARHRRGPARPDGGDAQAEGAQPQALRPPVARSGVRTARTTSSSSRQRWRWKARSACRGWSRAASGPPRGGSCWRRRRRPRAPSTR
jgi:Na+-driven multidrug efflux pump